MAITKPSDVFPDLSVTLRYATADTACSDALENCVLQFCWLEYMTIVQTNEESKNYVLILQMTSNFSIKENVLQTTDHPNPILGVSVLLSGILPLIVKGVENPKGSKLLLTKTKDHDEYKVYH